jgi:hypothetical protein
LKEPSIAGTGKGCAPLRKRSAEKKAFSGFKRQTLPTKTAVRIAVGQTSRYGGISKSGLFYYRQAVRSKKMGLLRGGPFSFLTFVAGTKAVRLIHPRLSSGAGILAAKEIARRKTLRSFAPPDSRGRLSPHGSL